MSYNVPASQSQDTGEGYKTPPLTFQILVLNCLNNIFVTAPKAINSGTFRDWQAIDFQLMMLTSYCVSYQDTEFKTKVTELKARLKSSNAILNRDYEQFREIVEQWLDEISKKFGYMGILPGLNTMVTMATREQERAVLRAKVEKKALMLLRLHGAELLATIKEAKDEVELTKEYEKFLSASKIKYAQLEQETMGFEE